MKNRSTVMQGIYIGIGLLLGNGVVLPLLSEKSFASGAREGAIGGVLAVALFAIVAAVKPAKSSETAGVAGADSGRPA